MEVTAPSAALVLGFPLLMMLVMLLMNAVERRLTGSGRPTVRLAPGGGDEDIGSDDPTPAATRDVDRPAQAEPRGSLRRIPAHLVSADFMPADLVPADLLATDAARGRAPATVRAAEAGILSARADAHYG